MSKIINIAVIAHVDAGKSTLVDAFLDQSGIFRENEEKVDCIMDSDAIERERGITIYSKNCSIKYEDYKINIVDTPGHADFSSEVERIIKTVDTVHRLIYNAMSDMFANGKVIDSISLADYLKSAGQLDKVGGTSYLIDLNQESTALVSWPHHVEILRRNSTLTAGSVSEVSCPIAVTFLCSTRYLIASRPYAG